MGSNLIYSIDGKVGLLNSSLEELTAPKFEEISRLSEGLHSAGKIINSKLKYGYLDSEGKEVCEFIFDDAYPFINNYAAVKLSDGWTFIDKDFKEISRNRFKATKDFNEGKAEVMLENNKWNFISEKGELLSSDLFEETGSFNYGFAMVKVNGKYGFIDETGQIKVKTVFSSQWRPFTKSGVAFVQWENESFIWKLVDKNGYVWPKDNEIRIQWPNVYANDLILVSKLVTTKDDFKSLRYGYMNLKKEIVFPLIYDYLNENQSGNELIGAGISVNSGYETFFLNVRTKEIIRTDYSFIGSFINGYAVVSNKLISPEKIKEKILDREANENDVFTITEKSGVVDNLGNLCIPTIYRNIWNFNTSFTGVPKSHIIFTAQGWESEFSGIINENNTIVVPFKWKEIMYLEDDAFLVKDFDNYYIYRVSSKEEILLDSTEYHFSTSCFADKTYISVKTKNNGLMGLMDTNGNWLISPKYNLITLNIKKNNRQ